MKKAFKESEQKRNLLQRYSKRVIRLQTQSDRGAATRTRNKSQNHMVSLGYLSDTSHSLT